MKKGLKGKGSYKQICKSASLVLVKMCQAVYGWNVGGK